MKINNKAIQIVLFFSFLIGTDSVFGQCGTTNYIVKSSGATTTTCSEIYDNGSNVGIGTGTGLSFYTLNSNYPSSPDVTPTLTVATPGGNAGFLLKGGTSSGSDGYWPIMGFGFPNTSSHVILGSSIQGVIINASAGSEQMDLAITTKPSAGAIAERVRVTNAGLVGIGTSAPAAQLDIYRPATGTQSSPVALSISNSDYSSSGSGTAFGIVASASSNTGSSNSDIAIKGSASGGGLVDVAVYGSASPGVAIGAEVTGGQFFSSGNSSSSACGVYGQASGSSLGNIGIYGSISSGSQPSDCAGEFNGDVLTSTNYYTTSDEKLKTNVQDFKHSLEQLKQLHVKTYDFKIEEYKNMALPVGNCIGIMAQNIQNVFPNLVKEKIMLAPHDPKSEEKSGENISFLAVNYMGLIPVLVEAVNELNAKTDSLAILKSALENTNTTIATMQKQMDEMCSNGCYGLKGTSTNETSGNASNKLLQNVPNPFANSTVIGYVLNTGNTAYMEINGLDGKLIQHIDLAGKGQGAVTVSSAAFSAGTYTYSLYVDGNAVDTKLMVIKSQE